MIEIREVLRLWLGGEGLRSIAQLVAPDRKTIRRYVEAAQAAGLSRDGGEGQLTDELLGVVARDIELPHFLTRSWCVQPSTVISGPAAVVHRTT